MDTPSFHERLRQLTDDPRAHDPTPGSVALLAKYFGRSLRGNGRLPDELARWMALEEQRLAAVDTPPATRRPLQLHRAGASLTIRLLSGPTQRLLLLEECFRSETPSDNDALASLTARERDVVRWVAHGKSNDDIGVILNLSPRTVAKHLEAIFRKLGVENRTAAAALVHNLDV